MERVNPLADRLQSIEHQTQSVRYNVIEESGNKAQEYAAEQPKLVRPVLQALGRGNNVDITV